MLHGRGGAGIVESGLEPVLLKMGKMISWVRVNIIRVFVAQSECRRSSNSLAGGLGCCLAGRLVVWLLTHASVLHAHVVHSSLIAVWQVH